MDRNQIKLLVVDDELEIRSLIVEYLHDIEGYAVFQASDAAAALELLEQQQVDLVLSDINMPGMKGFDLLKEIRNRYPDIKRILITAYNVEDYLELALKYDIGNIFVKTIPFNFEELSTVLTNLLANDIFGLDRYFTAPTDRMKIKINSSRKLEQHAGQLVSFVGEISYAKKLELVITELLTNAIFYGIRRESAEKKDLWVHDFTLPDDQAVDVDVARDDDKFAISISDVGGRLQKKDVLYWLNRQIAHDADGLPLGLFDSHGRGLFITRKYIDRLIINIDKTHRTEMIIMNYYRNTYLGYKPLYINEL
ncbi:MAG: response regulator [Chitinispirillaceae bacterium]|nr:response regulator [Chitinispirillaceae bacterium]